MAQTTPGTIIQVRRDSSTNWTSGPNANSILNQGEIGFETDTNKFKIGDGLTAWASLGYFTNTGVAGGAAALDGTGHVPVAQLPATTLTGDASGTGTGSFALTLAASGVTASTYTNATVTVDAKGRITSASSGTGGSATVVPVLPQLSSYLYGGL